jgi:epoxyqueuosine reductase
MTPCTLTRRGLNVIAVLDIVDTEDVLARFRQGFTHVVLVGSTGGAMWASMEAGGFLDRPHPVNDHAWAALDLFEGELRAEGRRTLRAWPRPPGSPGPEPSPLKITRLGELAGWGKRSPLGIGMHPRHGLWVGYRGVILVDGEFEGQREPPAAHACDTCESTPCVTVCPPSAIEIGGGKGIAADACFGERLREGAVCKTQCLARLACPQDGSRYPAAQIAHHQANGNRVFHTWRSTEGSGLG